MSKITDSKDLTDNQFNLIFGLILLSAVGISFAWCGLLSVWFWGLRNTVFGPQTLKRGTLAEHQVKRLNTN